MDVIILCLPLPLIWRLNMTAHKKVALSRVILLGSFVCVSSLLHIVSLGDIDDKDITYTLMTTGVWTSVEAPLAIVCACLPTLPAYFKAWFQRMTTSRSKGTNNAPFLRSLRSRKSTSGLAPKRNYENLEGRGATPLSDISVAKRYGSEEDHVGLDQIHVSQQFTVRLEHS